MKKKNEYVNLKEDKATKRIAELIPPENLKVYWATYQILKEYPLKNPSEYLKILKSITKDITWKIVEMKKIFTDNEVVVAALRKYLLKHQSLMETFVLFHCLKKGRGNIQRDFCLDFLIYAIVYDLRYYTGKPHYSMITEFLVEQGYDGDLLDVGVLKRHFHRIDVNNIVNRFLILYPFIYPACDYGKAFSQAGCDRVYQGFLYEVFTFSGEDNKRLGISTPSRIGT